MNKINLVLVDDHPLFREGVTAILGAEADIEIVGQGVTAQDALRLTQDLLPDMILLDISIPGNGLSAARTISAQFPVVKIIMLTGSADEDDVLAALKAGVEAYVLKGVAARELIGIIRTVQAGESYITPTLAASLLLEMTSTHEGETAPETAGALDELTERERQILELIADGKSNKEIGQRLFLAEKTVKHYVTNILQKLRVRNRVQAALLAQQKTRL